VLKVDVQIQLFNLMLILEADEDDGHSTRKFLEERRREDCIAQTVVANYGGRATTFIRFNCDRVVRGLKDGDIDFSQRMQMIRRQTDIAVADPPPPGQYCVVYIAYPPDGCLRVEHRKMKDYVNMEDLTSEYLDRYLTSPARPRSKPSGLSRSVLQDISHVESSAELDDGDSFFIEGDVRQSSSESGPSLPVSGPQSWLNAFLAGYE